MHNIRKKIVLKKQNFSWGYEQFEILKIQNIKNMGNRETLVTGILAAPGTALGTLPRAEKGGIEN